METPFPTAVADDAAHMKARSASAWRPLSALGEVATYTAPLKIGT